MQETIKERVDVLTQHKDAVDSNDRKDPMFSMIPQKQVGATAGTVVAKERMWGVLCLPITEEGEDLPTEGQWHCCATECCTYTCTWKISCKTTIYQHLKLHQVKNIETGGRAKGAAMHTNRKQIRQRRIEKLGEARYYNITLARRAIKQRAPFNICEEEAERDWDPHGWVPCKAETLRTGVCEIFVLTAEKLRERLAAVIEKSPLPTIAYCVGPKIEQVSIKRARTRTPTFSSLSTHGRTRAARNAQSAAVRRSPRKLKKGIARALSTAKAKAPAAPTPPVVRGAGQPRARNCQVRA